MMNEEEIRIAFRDKHILIVEDDPQLAPRLKSLFQRHGALEPVAEGSGEGGLKALLREDFDLAIVDVMLPSTDSAMKRNQAHNEAWTELQKLVLELPPSRGCDESPELASLRAQIDRLDHEIRANITDDAGVAMIEHWRKQKMAMDGSWTCRTAVLYLTAREPGTISERAEQAAPGSQWITKPATPAELVAKAAELVCNSRKG